MVNKVWDIVNEDRIRPPRPAVHELGVEVATSEVIADLVNLELGKPVHLSGQGRGHDVRTTQVCVPN